MDGGMEFTLIVIAVCSCFAVRAWVKARQREREAFYRAEAVKKIAEMQGNIPESVLSLLRAGIQQPSSTSFGSNLLLLLNPPASRRSEVTQKLADTPGGSAAVLEYVRRADAREDWLFGEWCKLGGLVLLGVGIGLFVFLRFYDQSEPVYLAGLIPILIGAALLVYAFQLKPNHRDTEAQRRN